MKDIPELATLESAMQGCVAKEGAMTKPEEVLAFWLDDLTPKDWYMGGDELDQKIKDRFSDAWHSAAEGGFGLWLTYPSGCLAYIILTDQLSRNMWRGDSRSFQLDRQARAAAKVAISRGWDKRIDAPARQFFYMPLMHSENLCDQDRCVRLMKERMPSDGPEHLLHAKAHREIIRKFGRFPFRNAALGRKPNPGEVSFLNGGGYSQIVNDLKEKAAA